MSHDKFNMKIAKPQRIYKQNIWQQKTSTDIKINSLRSRFMYLFKFSFCQTLHIQTTTKLNNIKIKKHIHHTPSSDELKIKCQKENW